MHARDEMRTETSSSSLSYDQLNSEYILCTLVFEVFLLPIYPHATQCGSQFSEKHRKENFRFPPNNKFSTKLRRFILQHQFIYPSQSNILVSAHSFSIDFKRSSPINCREGEKPREIDIKINRDGEVRSLIKVLAGEITRAEVEISEFDNFRWNYNRNLKHNIHTSKPDIHSTRASRKKHH